MKKKKTQKNKATKNQPQYLPFGVVINELTLWVFSNDEDLIRHNANELAKALHMSYNLSNFGVSSFGLQEDPSSDE
jgi:hypothetical protein